MSILVWKHTFMIKTLVKVKNEKNFKEKNVLKNMHSLTKQTIFHFILKIYKDRLKFKTRTWILNLMSDRPDILKIAHAHFFKSEKCIIEIPSFCAPFFTHFPKKSKKMRMRITSAKLTTIDNS